MHANNVIRFAAGTLPDGRIYLFSNAMPNTIRDPLTLLISSDGYDFNLAVAVMSCTLLTATSEGTPAAGNECGPKYPGKAKNPGVSALSRNKMPLAPCTNRDIKISIDSLVTLKALLLLTPRQQAYKAFMS